MRLEIDPALTHQITHTFPHNSLHTHVQTIMHIHSLSGDDSIAKWCTVVQYHIIVHHTEARGPIAVSIEHRRNKKKTGGKTGRKKNGHRDREVVGQNSTYCISCESSRILERRVPLFLCLYVRVRERERVRREEKGYAH